ncbi:MAG: lipase/acyltransferase domain-containing protein [Patescibacteria group bacterium UBA2103]
MRSILLAALCMLPLISQADIGHVPENISTLKEIRVTGNTIQELGTRISGTGTSLELYVTGLSLGTKILNTNLVACDNIDDSPKYSPSCEKILLGQYVGISTTSPAFQKQEYEFSYDFDPEKYYFLLFDHFGGGVGPMLGATTENTYPEGACHSIARDSDCTIQGTTDAASDFAFSIKGVEILPLALPENPPTDTPIIFLPGIFGSRLYHKEEKVWDGFAGEKMRELELDARGKSINTITVGEALFTFSAQGLNIDIYKPLKDFFNCSGIFGSSFVRDIPGNSDMNCNAPLIAYSYDWRYDVFEILDNGTNYTSGENVKLIDLVEHLSNNPTGKVHIVAHSNGGLLAKALMIRLEEQGKENLIDKIILVGSPQFGTPSAVGAILHGHDQQLGLGLVKRKDVSRSLSLNSLGAYSLLPSQRFIENNEPIIEFDSSALSNKYQDIFGDAIDSYAEFVTFLTDPANLRITPSESDLNAPAVLNANLLEKTKNTHVKIDAWTPPERVELTQIIGVGNETVSKYKYSTGVEFELFSLGSLTPRPRQKLWYRPVTTQGGDSTVIAEASESGVGKTYYFNLETLEDVTGKVVKHDGLLAEKEALQTIKNIFNKSEPSSGFVSKTREEYSKEKSSLFNIFSVYSPVIISVTDESGNITEINYDSGSDLFRIIENIPDSFVKFIGEAKYVFLPKDDYNVEVTGIDTGSFDLALSETNSKGEIIEIERFKNIPTKESAIAKVSFEENSLGDLFLDINNDNVIDYTFSPNESSESIRPELRSKMLQLEIRPQLKSAIEQYFELLENTESAEEKANYIAQIKRIVEFLKERYITKDTANTWSALAEHLQ